MNSRTQSSKRETRLTKLHVSATAQGKADGSPAHPFPTLRGARDALRKLRRRGAIKGAVRVLIAPGVYRLASPLVFTPEDGGTQKCPVTWAGDGARPLLSGARVIRGWQEGTINGRACWQATLPEVAAGRWWFTQLFVNGRRRLRARLPKQGFYQFAGVPADEAKHDLGGDFHGDMSAHFVPGEVRAFLNPADIDVVVLDRWFENHLRIASVDEATDTIRFATKGRSRFSRDETGNRTRFRLDHVAEGCTDPGDWYLDRATGILSYIPMPGEERAEALVEAPRLDRLLSIQGAALNPDKRVRHLRFEFLDLRHADGELPRDHPGSEQAAYCVPAAVRLVGAEDCALYGCRVSQVSGWAVEVLGGCQRNRIVACALHDLGGGGVKIDHEGDQDNRPGRSIRSESSATTVSDCSIHDGGLIFHSATGILVRDASRSRIVHNHIWNFNYTGISCGWSWGYAPVYAYDNRIEGNRIHGIGHGMLSDMGGIYTLGRQAGSTIRRNVISDVHSHGYGGWGIYPDEGSSWMRIEDNVVCNTKCGGFHQHYGRDNLVRHNIFANSVENQVAVTRHEFLRSMIFEGNLVQGAGNGMLWQSPGCVSARVDRNVYAGDPGRPSLFAGQTWEAWQAGGRDARGCFAEAMLMDAEGDTPVSANPAALKAAGISPKRVAMVVAQAGPRLRDVLPPTIDAIPAEKESPRAIVESLFWPWPAEWPGALTGNPSPLPPTAAVVPEVAHAISLTVENRGDASSRGRYRLRVIPSPAARLIGPKVLNASLKPGACAVLETSVVATGKVRTFRIEAVAEGDDLFDSCLHFSLAQTLAIPRLAAVPALKKLAGALDTLPSHPLDGNGRPVKAGLRLALAGDRLLLRVDTCDAAPVRGADPWEGSSIELFVAPHAFGPRVQLIAAPALGNHRVIAKLQTSAGPVKAAGARLTSATSADGWMLAAALPLKILGIDGSPESMVLDLVVNATRPGEAVLCRTHLTGAFNPCLADSSLYTRVTA
ncbi:MAG: right-handed parallel beta-helix repeat-containing protein [Verrucomicrobia bacterium]|nr:right-handed parallel beta-helix repeat-containing protein [Verrucomicrobiota bacterium]